MQHDYEALKPDNGKVNRVPISDYPFLKPQPIGTAVQPFVIPRLRRAGSYRFGVEVSLGRKMIQ